MEVAPDFVSTLLSALTDRPRDVFEGKRFTARIAIPDYDEHVARHYRTPTGEVRKALGFNHFGVIVDFDTPRELRVHNDDRCLDKNLRALLARFGPVLLRNVQLPGRDGKSDQRNIFPDLKFHIDRAGAQAEQISMFWRDPGDPVQREPRSSSTLVMPNFSARCQALEEGYDDHEPTRSYEFFGEANVSALIGKILLELPWDAACGIGEVSLLDNRTVVHASYYPRASDKGYPISVRYLS